MDVTLLHDRRLRNTPPPVDDPVGRMLDAQFSRSAHQVNQLLTDIALAGGISTTASHAGHVQIDGDRISVQWQGDAPAVLRRLAEAKGLKFAMIGRPVPIPVSIQSENADFVRVLENIGMQLGARADVVLKTDAVEIHYRAI
ncbi:TraH conjugal transfer protein [Candidatus Glomeribacter gigasporarum BEG34]|uniref:TraH conjugal transfer protein n=1 Tax=Candidatus Glomeribacter gigasporarum BEG34 TaxID=1070319 RepID=G2J824_9BURK|nr:DotD/TraH family lipoprotein [Candidatus Glomeribacter gigasporarum]CCD28921.1 TraH conjugal transfer protein [Candidatus Glomeribacter gigasporarum BEG34]